MEKQPIKIEINDKTVEAEQGWTILQAAQRAGASVPVLCYGRNLPLAEACRLCVVEVEGNPRPVAACSALVADGMKVKTNTPRVLEERTAILKLMLQDHYGDCLPPCNQRCPAGIDIQGYIALIARGRYLEAARLIRRTNPLPLTCGRVCPHPCESQCRRNRVDEPVNINHLKRFCTDIAYQDVDRLNPPRAPRTGKRVAIVGGGPAGLTAAFYLALRGHDPVIFEAMPELGGMLRYGIPEYRLPKNTLDREIEAILRLGVEVKTDTALGKDFTLEVLLEQGFDAVFLGLGAWANRNLGVPNENLKGVYYGTKFLADVALGKITQVGARVAVVGGGNTAIDCARTSLRMGADVTLYYRRSRKEMPAEKYEIDEAEREGVKIEILTLPVDLTCNDVECLTGMTFCRMELGAPDASGRASPKPVPGTETCVDLDTIIAAIGQMPDLGFRDGEGLAKTLEVTKWGTIQGQVLTGLTNVQGVFTAGDVMSGPATVVEAIGGARRAAEGIDRYLKGENLKPLLPFTFFKGKLEQVDPVNFKEFPKLDRQKMPHISLDDRKNNFREVELGLTEEQARAEALRCLSCGCQAAHDCRIRQVADLMGLRELLVNLKPTQPYQRVTDHPHIVIDDNKCVVCRACERACDAYHGRQAVKVELGPVTNPALHREHRTRLNQNCDHCGLCVSVCPTGALSFKPPHPKPGPYPSSWADSVCNLCPLGCRLRVGHLGDMLVEMGAPPQGPPNFGHLCRLGRFQLIRMQDSPDRILRPLVRRGGQWVEVSYEEALGAAVEGLLRIKKTDGPQALAALGTGRASAEEMLLLAKVARAGLGTENVDCADPATDRPEIGRLLNQNGLNGAMPSYASLEGHDLLVLVGSRLSRSLPLLESALHRARRQGAKVVLFAEKGDDLAAKSDLVLEQPVPEALRSIAESVQGTPGQDGLAGMLGSAKSPLLLTAESALDAEGVEAFHRLKAGLGAEAGRKLTLGVIPAMACGSAHRLLGLAPASSGLYADQVLAEAGKGRIKGMILQSGLVPALETASPTLMKGISGLQCLVLLSSFKSPLLEAAHVVLPTALGFEEEGVFVSGDGTQRICAKAVSAPEGVRSGWQVLADLLERLGGPAGVKEVSALRKEAASLLSGKRG